MTVDAASGNSRLFARWDDRAAVRTKPLRILDGEHAGPYFPPEFVPAAAHPLVAERGCGPAVNVQALLQYLWFTSELEQFAVLPVTASIASGRCGMEIPSPLRHDAYAITTDEAWHAQLSAGLALEVTMATGVAPATPETPAFVAKIAELRGVVEPPLRPAVDMMAAIVSETLISAKLADIPHDGRLPIAVREMVADHAEDEGRHHAYFRQILPPFWATLSPQDRNILGRLVPPLIQAFLAPDPAALRSGLQSVGFNAGEVDRILRESVSEVVPYRSARRAASSTVRYFREVGALDDAQVLEAFLSIDLV